MIIVLIGVLVIIAGLVAATMYYFQEVSPIIEKELEKVRTPDPSDTLRIDQTFTTQTADIELAIQRRGYDVVGVKIRNDSGALTMLLGVEGLGNNAEDASIVLKAAAEQFEADYYFVMIFSQKQASAEGVTVAGDTLRKYIAGEISIVELFDEANIKEFP